MWGPILSTLGNLAGTYLGKKAEKQIPGLSGAGNAGGQIGGQLGQMVSGEPAPGSGAAAGEHAKAYYKKLAPGLGARDYLGANNPGGQLAAVNKQTKVQERMQKADLLNKKEVAQIQGDNAVRAAAVPLGLSAVTSHKNMSEGKPGSEYDTSVAILRDKAKAEIPRLKAATELDRQRARTEKNEIALRKAEASISKLLALQKAFQNDPWYIRMFMKGAGGNDQVSNTLRNSLSSAIPDRRTDVNNAPKRVHRDAPGGYAFERSPLQNAVKSAYRRKAGRGSTRSKSRP